MAGWPIGQYLPAGRDLRIGTAEREQAVQLLTEHLAAGRLELAEFEERVDSVYAARTDSELAALFRDLPGPIPAPAGYPVGPSPRRLPRRPILLLLVVLLLFLLVADVAFPPLFVIPICLFVIHRRRRAWAMAGYRRR
jgi:hypothetical protein